MHIAEDETRATDAARTEADARAAGQVRADARRQARRHAKREATARAQAALDQREASVTDEDRRKGREERPERRRMKAEAKRQRLTGDATRTTDAEHTKADARAAGQRKDQLKATCDDPARARTALAPYEAGVTEEVRRRGREERPERKRTKAEAKH